MKNSILSLLVILCTMLTFQLRAQFSFTTNVDGTLTVTNYSGAGGNITFPTTFNGRTVSGISSYVFSNPGVGVTGVTIPGSITNLAQFMFAGDFTLTNAVLGEGIVTIPNLMFVSCFNLTSVTLPNGVKTIGSYAFDACDLSSVTIPTSVKTIGYGAFANTRLTNVTIPAGILNISGAFTGCAQLTNITLPLGLINLDGAFAYCSNLAGVIIPPTVTGIGDYTFEGCTSLTNVVFPASISTIGSNAFVNCTGLGSFTIPAGVTSIAGGISQGISGYAGTFAGCTNLTNLIILGAPNIGTYAFAQMYSLKSVHLEGGAVGGWGFQSCTNLTSLTFGKLPISLGLTCLAGCPISSLFVPANVTDIESDAFASCQLTNLVIGAGVANLGGYSFIQNSQLTNILMLGNAPYFPTGADKGPFFGCPATVYYLPGTTGWGPVYGTTTYSTGLPTALWKPGIQNRDGHLGVSNGVFGFSITNGGTTNIPIAILVCTNLANPVWTPLTNAMLTNTYYFTDSQWSNYPSRYYGIGFP